MKENIIKLERAEKDEQYRHLIPQIEALLAAETDIIANMANVSAVLKEVFDFFWIGFYRVDGRQLVLGPFQGSLACSRIAYGRGICGAAWEKSQSIVVPDVDAFPGHIACSSLSRSEIVVPMIKAGVVIGVLDIDSDTLAAFDETDSYWLEQIVALIVHYSQ